MNVKVELPNARLKQTCIAFTTHLGKTVVCVLFFAVVFDVDVIFVVVIFAVVTVVVVESAIEVNILRGFIEINIVKHFEVGNFPAVNS